MQSEAVSCADQSRLAARLKSGREARLRRQRETSGHSPVINTFSPCGQKQRLLLTRTVLWRRRPRRRCGGPPPPADAVRARLRAQAGAGARAGKLRARARRRGRRACGAAAGRCSCGFPPPPVNYDATSLGAAHRGRTVKGGTVDLESAELQLSLNASPVLLGFPALLFRLAPLFALHLQDQVKSLRREAGEVVVHFSCRSTGGRRKRSELGRSTRKPECKRAVDYR